MYRRFFRIIDGVRRESIIANSQIVSLRTNFCPILAEIISLRTNPIRSNDDETKFLDDKLRLPFEKTQVGTAYWGTYYNVSHIERCERWNTNTLKGMKFDEMEVYDTAYVLRELCNRGLYHPSNMFFIIRHMLRSLDCKNYGYDPCVDLTCGCIRYAEKPRTRKSEKTWNWNRRIYKNTFYKARYPIIPFVERPKAIIPFVKQQKEIVHFVPQKKNIIKF